MLYLGEINMNIFPQGAGGSKNLSIISDPAVTVAGYNDLKYMKPQQRFWMQPHYTVHFVLDGSGELKMAGAVHRISAGQIFIIPPNEAMMYCPMKDDIWRYIWFSVSGDKAGALFAGTGATRLSPVIAPENSEYIASLLTGIFLNGGFADDYRIVSVFYELLHCISKQPGSTTDAIRSMIDSSANDPDFTIAKLCRDCGLSHPQLCRVFIKRYGVTAKRYLIDRRMEYAKRLLRTTDLNIDAVALSSGYSDQAHFMKEFRRIHGTTAGEYRKTHK